MAQTRGFKGQGSSKANVASKEQSLIDIAQPNKESSTEFNKEDIERLRCLLESLNKSIGSCSLAKSGICVMTDSFKTSHTKTSRWVVDFGSTYYMTHDISFVDSYKPTLGNQKITIIDGSPIDIAR